ncbi:MAG TPA: superoxide dismutase, partial [Verrucomicrobiales bacterium]|nr:superoxide dismutase [Verrucomicrobiales bacterium]
FHIGGFRLHNRFWENMAPAGKGGGSVPKAGLAKAIDGEFGKFDRFKKEFTQAAAGVEGSGWAALTYCWKTGRPLVIQIEKHNVNVMPGFDILMVLDVWEHAYYLKYQNKRPDYIAAWWNVVNWAEVAKQYAAASGK